MNPYKTYDAKTGCTQSNFRSKKDYQFPNSLSAFSENKLFYKRLQLFNDFEKALIVTNEATFE